MDFEYYEELARTQGTFIKGDKKFDLGQGQLPEGLVFVDGAARIDGNLTGTNSRSLKTTLVSTGRIRISGSMQLAPASDDLLLIAKDNIEIAGSNNLTGAIYSRNESITLKGNNNCQGTIIAKSGISITGGSTINH